jgi:hypothetical protein
VVLFLNSDGGEVNEGDRVIHLLDGIKPTHRLITVVLDGSLCASMCIPVFLQGDDRLAARTSRWIFHEAARQGVNQKERMEETLRLLQKYYLAAGVSPGWIKRSCLSLGTPTSGDPAATSSVRRAVSSHIRWRNGQRALGPDDFGSLAPSVVIARESGRSSNHKTLSDY